MSQTAELEDLKNQLAEARELLRAIHAGEVDAVVVSGPKGAQVFTLEGADRAYRVLIEAMNEGALTLSADGTVLYCNHRLSGMLKTPLERIIGKSIHAFFPPDETDLLKSMQRQSRGQWESRVEADDGSIIPVLISVSPLQLDESQQAWCLIVTDLTEQKQREEIVASERLARSMIEQAVEAIVVCDEQGRIIRFNKAASEIAGGDLSFKRSDEILELQDEKGIRFDPSPITSALQDRVLQKVKAVFKRGDDRTFNLLVSAGPLKNSEDEIIGCVVTLYDVTDSKRMEEELRNSEEKSRTIVKYAPSMIYEIDFRGPKFISVNDVMCTALAYSREELLAKNPIDLLQGDSREIFQERMRKYLAGESVSDSVEYAARTKDGRLVYGLLNISFTREEGKPMGAVVVAQDITERKKAEQALHESQALLRAVMEGTSDPVYVKDCQSRILMANQALAKVAGKPIEEILGKTDSEYYGNIAVGQALHEHDLQVMASGQSAIFEETVPTPTGNRTFLSNKAPHRSPSGEIIGIIGISRDVTEHKQAAEERKRLLDGVQAERDRISALVASMQDEVWFADTKKRFTLANPAAVKEFGLDKYDAVDVEEFITGLEVLHPDGSPRPIEEAQPLRALKGEVITNEEEIVRTPASGELRHRLVSATPVRDRAGQIIGSVSVVRDITERKKAEELLQKSEARLAADLAAMTRLQKLSASFVQEGDLTSLLDEIMETAIALAGADKGILQLVRPDSNSLEIFSQRGFGQSYLESFSSGSHGVAAVCSSAFQKGERVIVEDVTKSPIFIGIPALDMQLGAGVRAVQSTPLVNRRGEMIGMLSTHWGKPHHPDERALRYIDLLARQAAEIIERNWAEKTLRENEKRLVVDLYAMTRLQRLGELFVHEGNLESVLGEIVNAAIAISSADFGNIQILNPASSELKIVAQHGFPGWWIDFWNNVSKGQGACGTALQQGERVIIEDVEQSPIFVGTPALEMQLKAGVRAVQSTPLVSRSGRTLGMFSTHYRTPHRPDDHALRLLDLLSRQAADIIERMQADEALRETKDYLENLISYANAPVIVWDTSFKITRFNHAFEQLTGLRAADVIGRQLDILFPDESKEASLEHIRRTLSGERWEVVEIPILRTDGSVRTVLWNSASIYDKERVTVVATIAQGQDITERKQAEKALLKAKGELELRVQERTEELEAANEELKIENEEHLKLEEELRTARDTAENAVRAKADFMANMSHEIRTPMNAVIGMSSILLEEQLTLDQKDYVETIRSSGNALLVIINDILDFSRLDREKAELEEQFFDLRSLVEESLDQTALKAAEKGINMGYIMARDVPETIYSDPARLRQVLLNLLNNAVKFTEKGEILVSVGQAPAGVRHEIRFSVQDTGIGIPQEQQEAIFEPFSQADTSLSRNHNGVGLGLAITKKLVELMGGKIGVKSEPGKGSCFRFDIMAKVLPAEPSKIPSGEQPALKGKRMLVIDKSKANRMILGRLLHEWGVTPLVVASVKDAKESGYLNYGQDYDAAILGANLEEIEGIALVGRMREKNKRLPMLLLAPIGMKSTEGFTAVVLLPIKPLQLFNTLVSVFALAPAKEEAGNGEQSESGSLRILLAEDNASSQKVTLQMLKKLGYRADLAANGQEAIDALKRQHYDLVLMDVKMPILNGWDATRQIRRLWPDNGPKIIALTAYALAGDREKCMDAGMDGYIAKPVALGDLRRILREAMN